MYTKTLLSVCVALALSHPAFATENNATTTKLDKVVVTATRSNESVANTAAAVSVIKEDDIEKTIAKNIADILEYTPGVTTNSTGRQGIQSINIRGIEDNRVKILVDGATQGQSYDGGTTAFINSSAITIDPDMLKRVEIVKGSASSLYGSDALGGVVAFETKDPRDFLKDGKNFGGQAKLTYSSADKSFSEHAAVASRVGDLETLVAYTRRDGKELQNFRNKNDLSNYSVKDQDSADNDVLVKLQYQLNNAHRIEFIGEVVHNESDSDIYNSSYSNYTGDDTTKRYRLGLKDIWYADNSFADVITSSLTWQYKKDRGLTHRDTSDTNTQTKDYFYRENATEFETQISKYAYLLGVENNFVYGLNYRYSDIDNLNNEYNTDDDDDVIVYTPNATQQTFGIFMQDEINLLDGALKITPGVRFDYFATDPGSVEDESYDKFDDSAVTGRLGAVYHLTDNHSVFAQVSQGFRAPTFKELYYSYGHPEYGYESVPNADLKSETSISYELGYRYNTDLSSSSISAYYSDYDNFIDYSYTGTSDGLMQYSYVNLDSATIKGIELSNTMMLGELIGGPKGLSTRVAANYTEGEDGDGADLESVNPWNAVVALNYDSDTWGSSVKFNYTARKSMDDSSQVTLPSASIVDLTAYYKPIKDLTLYAGIFNLTNEKYYRWNDVRGDSELKNEDTQAKRNYSISAKYEF